MSSRNPNALNIFNGQLEVEIPKPPIPPAIIAVKVSKIKAGGKLTFEIHFNQRVDDFTIDDILVTAPAQLISWLGTGSLRPILPVWKLEYNVSGDFDASALPDDYTLSISIRANSIIGKGINVIYP